MDQDGLFLILSMCNSCRTGKVCLVFCVYFFSTIGLGRTDRFVCVFAFWTWQSRRRLRTHAATPIPLKSSSTSRRRSGEDGVSTRRGLGEAERRRFYVAICRVRHLSGLEVQSGRAGGSTRRREYASTVRVNVRSIARWSR